MIIKFKFNNIFSITVLLFLSALTMLKQLGTADYFNFITEDAFTFTRWAWQFNEALKEGVIYPRWMPFNFWGYGSPTFILYPPLAFYLVAFFNIFTDSTIQAMNIVKFISLFLGAMGIFFLVREFYSQKVALLTASFYILLPYNIYQIYYAGTFASIISFMWFSPILLFICKYLKSSQHIYVIYAGVCYGGLILTHLINAYMFTFIIAAFVIYMSIVNKNLKDLLIGPFMALTGVIVSAAYILPLVYEKQLVNLKGFITYGGGFSFVNFFIFPGLANLQNYLPPDNFWRANYGTFIFYVFFFGILTSIFFMHSIKSIRINHMPAAYTMHKFFLGTSICSIFFLFGISSFIWEYTPFFKYIQYPIRWLHIIAFAVVFLSSAAFHYYGVIKTGKKSHLFIAVLFLLCFYLDCRYINSASAFAEQELMSDKAVNVAAEHLPIGLDINKIDSSDENTKKIAIIHGKGTAEIVEWWSEKRKFTIKAGEALTLRIRTFNFPGWKAYINETETAIKTEKDTGAMLINIPRGDHIVRLKFEDTPIRHYSKIVSMIAILGIVLIAIKTEFLKRK